MRGVLGFAGALALACGGGPSPTESAPVAAGPVAAGPVAPPTAPLTPAPAPPASPDPPVASASADVWAVPEPDLAAVIASCEIGKPDGSFVGGESAPVEFEFTYQGTWTLTGDTLAFEGRKTGNTVEMRSTADGEEAISTPVDEPYARTLTGVSAWRRGADVWLQWDIPTGERAGKRGSRWCRAGEDIPYARGWYDNVTEVQHVVIYDAGGGRTAMDAAAGAIAGLECPYACYATIDGGAGAGVPGKVAASAKEDLTDALAKRFGAGSVVSDGVPDGRDPLVVFVGAVAP